MAEDELNCLLAEKPARAIPYLGPMVPRVMSPGQANPVSEALRRDLLLFGKRLGSCSQPQFAEIADHLLPQPEYLTARQRLIEDRAQVISASAIAGGEEHANPHRGEFVIPVENCLQVQFR